MLTYKKLLNGKDSILIEKDGFRYLVFESAHKNDSGTNLVAVMIRDINQGRKIIFHERYNPTDEVLKALQ